MTLQKPVHQVVATVLGAGTMGAGIAAHLAAAGCKTYLLDIVPRGADADAPPSERSVLSHGAIKALTKSKPPALMSPTVLDRLLPGNLEDDLATAVSASDLVIEAVVERLDVKTQLFSRVAEAANPECILASNTSGIPISDIAEVLPEPARKRFLGLHFFNPPRWMHLLEVIPSRSTDEGIVAEAAEFCDRALGKGIVRCRDTPNFIGNRIGIAEMLLTFRATQEVGLRIEQVDFLNGPLIGRPKTGTFRLGDLVGVDVIGHVVKNLQDGLTDDPKANNFDPLYELMKVPTVVERLIEAGRLGDKSGAGFYKKTTDDQGNRQILALELDELTYRPSEAAGYDELAAWIKKQPVEIRIRGLLERPDEAGHFARRVLLPLFNYSASLAGTICETPQEIDDAMRWGYGWQLGPFQMIDAAGPAWVVEQLRQEGHEPASSLVDLVEREGESGRFYGGSVEQPRVLAPSGKMVPCKLPPGAILLRHTSDSKIIEQNPSAALWDLDDGIACLEFRSKANVLDEGVVQMIAQAPQLLVERGFRGMVLGNQADHFCRGANLAAVAEMIQRKDFGGVEQAIEQLQDAFMNLRHGPIPVVAAPLGQTLGGGTEACLHCAEIQAGSDLFMGLVEVGVGVLPAGGGLKEIARRASAWAKQVPDQEPYPWVRRGFEAVATAKLSMSAFEARDSGFLSSTDGITFHRDRVLADAKARALGLATRGWVPPDRDELIDVIAEVGGANLLLGVQVFEWGGYASAHDKLIGRKIVHVLSGGMAPRGTRVTAQQLLDLEREAFVSLCGEEKTFARIEHMLRTKRPLRN